LEEVDKTTAEDGVLRHRPVRFSATPARSQVKHSLSVVDICRSVLERLLLEFPYDVVIPCLLSVTCDGGSREHPLADVLAKAEQESTQTAIAIQRARIIVDSLTAVGVTLTQFCFDALSRTREYLNNPSDIEERRFRRDCVAHLRERLKNVTDAATADIEMFPEFRALVDRLDAQSHEPLDELKRMVSALHGSFDRLVRQEHRVLLSVVAPQLASWEFRDFPLFGTPGVSIISWEDEVKILASKQRPRLVRVRGSDGHAYGFLLKAHEDLRNDQRVMRLCSLMNGFLKTRIRIIAIVPLTSTLGIIQWMPNTASLFDLIEPQLRATHDKQAGEVERDYFLSHFGISTKERGGAHSIAALGVHRLEAFRRVLRKFEDHETALREAIWKLAPHSEAWLSAQANYTKSLAVMSMVGYIIGLGDRHARNIMLERERGRIVHIDFGDLYDTARRRKAHPEHVPFRLTRMLVSALGPRGYDGMFRKCCEDTLLAARQNREALLSMLEINQRDPTRLGPSFTAATRSASEVARSTATAGQGQAVVVKKVTGLDCSRDGKPVTVKEQVSWLIKQAVDPYNLCRNYPGWYPWW
jgi:FKBP12-rapamycin complex-associated protein